MSKFAAVCASDYERSKDGFETEANAEEYIKGFLCGICREDMERGYILVSGGDEPEEKMEINIPTDTACGAEWYIISSEAWKTYTTEEKPFSFLLEAAGYTLERPNDEASPSSP